MRDTLSLTSLYDVSLYCDARVQRHSDTMSLNESRLYGRLGIYHKVSVVPSFPSVIFISKDVMADTQ